MPSHPPVKTNISATLQKKNLNAPTNNVMINGASERSSRSRSSVDLVNQRGEGLYLPHYQSSSNNDLRTRIKAEYCKLSDELENRKSELENSLLNAFKEVRTLRTLIKRQERALANYEADNADLPRLMRQHEEEMRFLVTSNRKLTNRNRELEQEVKKKDAMLLHLGDRNRFFCELNRNKDLKDRHSLAAKVSELELKVLEKHDENRMLARRMQFESKQYKSKLALCQKKMKEANAEVQKLRKDVERLLNMDLPMKHKTAFGKKQCHKDEDKLAYMSSGSLSDSDLEKKLFEEDDRKKRASRNYLKKEIHNFKLINQYKKPLKKTQNMEHCSVPLLPQIYYSSASKDSSDKTSDTLVAEYENTTSKTYVPMQSIKSSVPLTDNDSNQYNTALNTPTETIKNVSPSPDRDSKKTVKISTDQSPICHMRKENDNYILCDSSKNILQEIVVNNGDVKEEMEKIYIQHCQLSLDVGKNCEELSLDVNGQLERKKTPSSKQNVLETPSNCTLTPYELHAFFEIIKADLANRSLSSPPDPLNNSSTANPGGTKKSRLPTPEHRTQRMPSEVKSSQAPTPDPVSQSRKETPDSLSVSPTSAENRSGSKSEKSLSKRKSLTKEQKQGVVETKARNVAYVEPVSHPKQSRPNSKTKIKSSVSNNNCNDYKEREAFLDTFCRQANSMKEPKPTKRNSVSETLNSKEFSESRKQKLLAKLKAIEETMTD